MNPLSIIQKYYPVDTEAYHILVVHSRSVADKALAIAKCHRIGPGSDIHRGGGNAS